MRASPFSTNLSADDLKQLGITSSGMVRTSDIVFADEVRRICEGNLCGGFGKTWACPPAIGTLEECRDKILRYPSALVFNAVYELEDSFDFEGMTRGHQEFKKVCDRLYEHLEKPFLLLSNEGCSRCSTCTYPDAPCRFPDKLFPALEGCGIYVNLLAKSAGLAYINGVNTVTYFGMICFE